MGTATFVSSSESTLCVKVDNKAIDDHEECFEVAESSKISPDLKAGDPVVYEVVSGVVKTVTRGDRLDQLDQ